MNFICSKVQRIYRKKNKHLDFTSFSILNDKYSKLKTHSKLANDKLIIYKNINV